MWALHLQEIVTGKEKVVCIDVSAMALIEYFDQEKVEPYMGRLGSIELRKEFREGGPFEWFCLPPNFDASTIVRRYMTPTIAILNTQYPRR